MTNQTNHAPRCGKRHTVLILDNEFQMGGLEKNLYDFLRATDRDHFNYVVCCLKQGGYFKPRIEALGIPFHENLLKHKYDMTAFVRLRQLVESEQVDLIDTYIHPNTMIFSFLARAMGLVDHFVVNFHATESSGGGRLIQPYIKPLLTSASGFIAVGEEHKKYLLGVGGLTDARWRVIYNGVDTDRFHPGPRNETVAQEIGITERDFVMVTVASLKAVKRIDVFLRACKHVFDVVPQAKAVVVGDGPDRASLESLSGDLGIADRVRFTGIRGDVDEILRLADVFLLTSDREAFPVGIIEAMAAELPVVSTNVGSVRESVADGVTGFLHEAGDFDGLAKSVLRLADDRGRAREFGVRGREVVARQFALTAMVRRREDFLCELLCKRWRES